MEITFYYPTKKWLESASKELEMRNSVSSLEKKYSSLLKTIRSMDVKIQLEPMEKQNETVNELIYYRKIVGLILDNKCKLKSDWSRVVSLIECDFRNLMGMVEISTDSKGKELMMEIAEKKCVPMQECWEKLGYNTVLNFKREYNYYYYSYYSIPKEWSNSKKTTFLSYVADYVCAVNKGVRNTVSGQSKCYYLVPKSFLIEWAISLRYKGGKILNAVDEISEGLTIYDGSDFIIQLPVFLGMKTSGLLQIGATKVPVAVGKKVSAVMNLTPLPGIMDTVSDRSYILAMLGAYACPNESSAKKGKKNEKKKELTSEDLMRGMYEEINYPRESMLRYLLSVSIPKPLKQGLDAIDYNFRLMERIIMAMMNNLPADKDDNTTGAWVSFENVMDWILGMEALNTSRVNWLECESVDFVTREEYIYYPDVYERIKYPVIAGLIQMLASLGLIEYAYEKSAKSGDSIKYLRITNAGLWCAKRVDRLSLKMKKIDDGLNFDPETLMITIKDTKSPNYQLLCDLTEKITTTRFRITESALLRGCKTLPELHGRIDRLENYLLDGQKSVGLTLLKSSLICNVDKVKKANMDDYIFMEVDSEDEKLHHLLVSDPTIRKNTLRVEGWKLLVKKTFYQSFLDRLRLAGYLTES